MTRDFVVTLHGHPVATLTEDRHQRWNLRFSDRYRRMSRRPVLGQKFEDDLERAYRGKQAGDLPPFFANLVPERDGELRPILEQALGVAEGDDLGLLAMLGRDLPGAVEVHPAGARDDRDDRLRDDVVEPTVPRDHDDQSMRFSLAGVQLKFSVLLANDRVTLPAHGGLGDWLVKLDSRRFPHLCENEAAMMRWARQAGFEVPEFRLLPARDLVGKLGDHAEPDSFVLAVRRYDRAAGQKIHQEDFAQVTNLNPKHKYDHVSYEALARLVETIIDARARDQLIARLAFMIASGNGDAHLKNWSLIYPDQIRAALSPLYDQVSTVAWPEIEHRFALNFAGDKDMAQLTRAQVERFAARAQLPIEPTLAIVDDTLARLAACWPAVASDPAFALPQAHLTQLRAHWQRTPLLRASPLGRL